MCSLSAEFEVIIQEYIKKTQYVLFNYFWRKKFRATLCADMKNNYIIPKEWDICDTDDLK